MDKAKKAANFGQCRNYQQEAGMEPRVNAGEQSYAKAGTEGKDKSELNTRYLLETGTQGRDRQAGWRSKIAGNPNGNRPDDPTGYIPGIDTDI